jgi:glutathione synthase/RimK-type ligase-like ATP-grasp enzyme
VATSRIGFVTCEQRPAITADDLLAADALRCRGYEVTAALWSDQSVDWQGFSSVVIRSPWDYHLDDGRYRAWLRGCERDRVNLWNPASAVLANLDKRYLLHLARAGAPTIPGEYVERGQVQSLAALLERRNWPRAVVKPAVSASAYGTWRTSLETAETDQRQWSDEVEQRSLLVQPFTDEIVTSGEWSVVFFDGHYSHAVLKTPAAGDFRVQEELGGHAEPREPSRAVIEQARHVLSFVEGPLLYARVDGVERDGQFLLMELEVNEPVLYLAASRAAPERFALAIARSVTAPLHG